MVENGFLWGPPPVEAPESVVKVREHINKGNGESKFKKIRPILSDIPDSKKGYRLAWRKSGQESTVVGVGRKDKIMIGGKDVVVMAGPCSVESEVQMMAIAKKFKEMGGGILRAGAYKPRTSIYDFQGLGKEGLKILRSAADKYDLKVVTEVMGESDVDLVGKYTDIYQVGSRNAHNNNLLKELGRRRKPVLLKRGMISSYKEFLSAAEYILALGNKQVILCERGIKTPGELRNTTDINAIPYFKRETHLPVILDPSHSTGRADLVEAVSLAGIAAGADGLLIEAHIHPKKSISDADQAISMKRLESLMKKVRRVAGAIGRGLWNSYN